MSFKTKLKRWFFKLMIRTKRIKHVSFTPEELNEMLGASLPESFALTVPGCTGNFVIESADLTMPAGGNHFHVALFCSLHIEAVANPIYRAHLLVELKGLPFYEKSRYLVRLQRVSIHDMKLVKDEYGLIKDTKYIISSLVPSPLKSVITATVSTTLNVLSNGIYPDMKSYLSLYLTGSKQKIIDYHRPELESIVINLAESGDLEYQLDREILEESLFAELGKDVQVKDGELQFIFHNE